MSARPERMASLLMSGAFDAAVFTVALLLFVAGEGHAATLVVWMGIGGLLYTLYELVRWIRVKQ